jgi:hypothetical protein
MDSQLVFEREFIKRKDFGYGQPMTHFTWDTHTALHWFAVRMKYSWHGYTYISVYVYV